MGCCPKQCTVLCQAQAGGAPISLRYAHMVGMNAPRVYAGDCKSCVNFTLPVCETTGTPRHHGVVVISLVVSTSAAAYGGMGGECRDGIWADAALGIRATHSIPTPRWRGGGTPAATSSAISTAATTAALAAASTNGSARHSGRCCSWWRGARGG